MLREALTNVARHAGGTRADVAVTVDAEVVLRVVDDGKGLPEERRPGGHGLANMAARASRLGGSVTAGAGAGGSGTVVDWRVPAT